MKEKIKNIFHKYLEDHIKSWPRIYKISVLTIFLLYLFMWGVSIWWSGFQGTLDKVTPLPFINGGDSLEYKELSESLKNQFSFDYMGHPETFRTPGYPIFIAIISYLSGTYFTVALLQIILLFLTAITINKICLDLGLGKFSYIASSLILINPISLMYSITITSEILFLFLYTQYFYICQKLDDFHINRKLILLIILAVLAIYVRPFGIFALPIFLVPIFINNLGIRRKSLLSLFMVFSIVLLIIPWMIRNHKVSGVFSYTSLSNYNLAYYNLPMFNSWVNNSSQEDERFKIQSRVNIPISSWRDLESSEELKKVAVKDLMSDPIQYTKFHLIKTIPFFFSSSLDMFYQFVHYELYQSSASLPSGTIDFLINGEIKNFFQSLVNVWWRFVERIAWLIIYLVGMIGLWLNRKKLFMYGLVFIILYLALLAGPVSNARYRLQTEPYIFILMSIGLASIYNKVKAK